MKSYILALSALFLSPLVHCQLCPPSPNSAPPAGSICGETERPRPNAATARALGTSTVVQTQQDCVDACFSQRNCAYFTYEAKNRTCNTYKYLKHGLKLESSPGGAVKFWNTTCYQQKQVFDGLSLRLLNGMATNGQYLAIEQGNSLNPLVDVIYPDEPDSSFSLACNGSLINDGINLLAYQIYNPSRPSEFFSTVFFPTEAELSSGTYPYVPVTCSLNSDLSVSCSSAAGNVVYLCSGSASGSPGAGIAISTSAGPPANAAYCQETGLYVS